MRSYSMLKEGLIADVEAGSLKTIIPEEV